MLELVISACLATGPCQDFSQLYDPREIPLMVCIAAAQPEIARWQSTHADWTVKRWRCGYIPDGRAEL